MDFAMRVLCPGERLLDKTGAGLCRLNVTVRRCRRGQCITPHVDRRCYEEPVWAAVLFRTESCPTLQYKRRGAEDFALPEQCGAVHRIIGDARWYWRHGLDELGEHDERVSVSWRWFRSDHQMRWEGKMTGCPTANEAAVVESIVEACSLITSVPARMLGSAGASASAGVAADIAHKMPLRADGQDEGTEEETFGCTDVGEMVKNGCVGL